MYTEFFSSHKMGVIQCKDKIEALFRKIYEDNYHLDTINSECLLRCLGNSIKSTTKYSEHIFFLDLVTYCVAHTEGISESTHLLSLELVRLYAEHTAKLLDSSCTREYLVIFFRNSLELLTRKNQPSVRVCISIIKLIESVIPNRSGISWIIKHKIWKFILHQHIHRRSPKLAQASYQFISKLVWVLDKYDSEQTLIEVLDHFVKPIIDNEYNKVETLDADGEDEQAIVDNMLPYFNALLTVLRDNDNESKNNKVVSFLTYYYSVEYHIYMISEKTNNQNMMNMITEILFHLWYHALKVTAQKKTSMELSFELLTIQYSYMRNIVYLKGLKFILDFMISLNLFWHKKNKGHKAHTFERHGNIYEVEVQMMSLLVIPFFVFADKYHIDNVDFVYKMLKVIDDQTVNMAYMYKDTIVRRCRDLKKMIIQNLRQFTRLIDYINTAQAGIMYQALHYVLKNCIAQNDNKEENEKETELVSNIKSLEDIQIITLILDIVKMLLLKHDINWYENVEIICLQSILVQLLKINDLPTKQTVQTLGLIEVCIKKFLSPELSLLIKNDESSYNLQEIGQLMAMLISNEAWEIRDSVISLLLICIDISFVKYVPMRKIIMDNDLTTPLVNLALTDEESYVRANALKCLAATTTTENLWNKIIDTHQNLLDQIIHILTNHPESIVKKEAARVLTKFYINCHTSEVFQLKMYSLMTDVALDTLHWEVQIEALKFWKQVIENELYQRGMIDGKFPKVTFSKEKHKIIILNDKEIQNQLTQAMSKLSENGSLAVLQLGQHEDSNTRVVQQAHGIAKELVTILEFYNFQTEKNEQELYKKECEVDDLPTAKQFHETIHSAVQDDVIDDILSRNFSELAVDLYNNQSPQENCDTKKEYQKCNKKIMSPADFLHDFQRNEVQSLSDDKDDIDNLESILDYLLNHSA